MHFFDYEVIKYEKKKYRILIIGDIILYIVKDHCNLIAIIVQNEYEQAVLLQALIDVLKDIKDIIERKETISEVSKGLEKVLDHLELKSMSNFVI